MESNFISFEEITVSSRIVCQQPEPITRIYRKLTGIIDLPQNSVVQNFENLTSLKFSRFGAKKLYGIYLNSAKYYTVLDPIKILNINFHVDKTVFL